MTSMSPLHCPPYLFFHPLGYFPTVGKIPYEGPDSDNVLAFKYYDADRVVMGKVFSRPDSSSFPRK